MDQQPKPPKPSSLSSFPRREIRHIELGAGQDYQLSTLEAFRIVDGDVSVHLVISPGAEPVFCYDVGKGGIIHPEALVDPFELPGVLRLVALKRTKLEAISPTEFRADYARMVGHTGPLAYFRSTELAEIREAALKTFFRIGNALRDAIAAAEQSRRDRRMSAARESMNQRAHAAAPQGMDQAFKKRFSEIFAAMFELEPNDVADLVEKTETFIAKGKARTEQQDVLTTSSVPEPPPPREKLSTIDLTGPDGLGGLEHVIEDEEAPPTAASPSDAPPWTGEAVTGVVVKPQGISVPPPKGASIPVSRTTKVIVTQGPPPLPDPFAPDPDFEDPGRPSLLPPPPTEQVPAVIPHTSSRMTQNMGSLPVEPSAKDRPTLTGLDEHAVAWEQGGRPDRPPSSPTRPKSPQSGNPLGRTLPGLGAKRPISAKETAAGLGTPNAPRAPKPPR